jgi:hypothetical protein
VCRYLGADARAASGTGIDLEGPADGRDPVGEVGEAGPTLDGRGIEARAIVLDAEGHVAIDLAEADRRGGFLPGVLGRVLEALLAAEVDVASTASDWRWSHPPRMRTGIGEWRATIASAAPTPRSDSTWG